MLLEGHKTLIRGLAFSPIQSLLASGDDSGVVNLWDSQDGHHLGILLSEIEDLNDIASTYLLFSPDGMLLATGSMGKGDFVRIWNIKSRSQVAVWQYDWISCLAWSPDNNLIAVCTENIAIYNVKTGKLLKKLEGILPDGIMGLAWSPDGKLLACGGSLYEPDVVIWDIETSTVKAHLPEKFWNGGHIEELVFVSDKKLVYSHGYGTAFSWDIEARQVEKIFDIKEISDISGLGHFDTISKDGRLLAYSDERPDIHVVELATKKDIFVFDAHAEGVISMAFSSDGCSLASGDYEGKVYLWNL